MFVVLATTSSIPKTTANNVIKDVNLANTRAPTVCPAMLVRIDMWWIQSVCVSLSFIKMKLRKATPVQHVIQVVSTVRERWVPSALIAILSISEFWVELSVSVSWSITMLVSLSASCAISAAWAALAHTPLSACPAPVKSFVCLITGTANVWKAITMMELSTQNLLLSSWVQSFSMFNIRSARV